MNNFIPQIIEFLSNPEVGFGTDEDMLLLEDSEALHQRVAALLDEFPNVLEPEETAALKAHLDKVPWSFVALEIQARIDMASKFSDADEADSADG